MEEKIKELKEQREAHSSKRSKLEAERKECHEKCKQVDSEAEAISSDIEELRVCVHVYNNMRMWQNQKSTVVQSSLLRPPN